MSVCRECGLTEEEHHEFRPYVIPVACKCNPIEWRDPDRIPAICRNWTPMDAGSDMCLHCEHEEACHGSAS